VTTGPAPPPPLHDPEIVRFLALGDVGKGTETQRRVARGAGRACAELGCDFAVLLGDNLYPAGMETPDDPRMDAFVGDMYAGLGVPVYLVLGNHDYGRGRDDERAAREIAWASRSKQYVLPSNAWVTDAGPVRLVGLDTNAAFEYGSSFQTRWLKEQLDGSSARWKVVLGHHPYRSNGLHGNAGSYEGWSYVPWLSGETLRSMFDEGLCGRADLYLSGHDHNRQLLDRCGVTLVVSGAAAETRGIVDRGNEPAFASDRPGVVWVELGPERGTVAFVDADGAVEARFPIQPRTR
jgi:predicted phosphodiesterase